MATRKTVNAPAVGLFASPSADAGNNRRKLAVLPNPAPPIVAPVAKSSETPWESPESKLRTFARDRHCPHPPRHPIHAVPDPGALVIKLRCAFETRAPDWLCYELMRDAAYAIEATLQHCYLCNANGIEDPCDPGNRDRDEAQAAADECPHYKSRMEKGIWHAIEY